MAQLQSTSITGSLIVTGGITGSFSGSIASPGSNTQVLYNNSGVISANSGFVYSSGNVGIGTTNPGYKLDVIGNARIGQTSDNSTAASLQITSGGSGYDSFIDFGYWGTFDAGIWYVGRKGATNSFFISNYGGGPEVNTLTILSGGNIGIGTTNPAQKLHVIGNTAVTGFTSTGGRKLSLGILDLNSGDTPTQIRINTTIPLNSPSADFTVNIKGFRYGAPQMVSLSIGWHYYLGSFYNETVISNGAWKPTVTLAQDANGYVVIHLSSPGYWPKLYVESLYSSAYGDTYSSGWTFTDANLSDCTNVEVVPYQPLATDISGNAGSTSAVSGTTNYIPKFTSSTAIGNSIMYDASGDILIGTTTSIWANSGRGLIQINGTSQALLGLSINGTSAGYLYHNGTDLYNWNASNGAMIFGTNNTEKMCITAAGNVGIGVTNPNTLLEVNKNISFSSVDTYAQLVVKTTSGANGKLLNIGVDESAGLSFIQSLNRGTDSMPLILQRYSGNVGIGTTNPGSKLHVTGEVRSSTTTSTYGYIAMQPGGDTVQGYIEWFKPGPTRVAYMGYNDGNSAANLGLQLENSANFIINGGSIGIGTTNPTQKLQIAGNIALGSTSLGYLEAGSKYIGTSYSSPATDGWNGIQIESVNAPAPYDGNYSQNLKFYTHHYGAGTGATPRVTIQYDGNVGIGNTSPTSKLYVEGGSTNWDQTNQGTAVGTIHLDPGVTTDNFGNAITFGASDSSAGATAQAGIYVRTDGSYGSKMYFSTTDSYVAGSKTRMIINESGNVGIGTTNPNGLLVLDSGEPRFRMNIAGTNHIILNHDGSTAILRTESNTPFTFGTNGTERMRIAAAGNIGIGTTNPGQKLEVDGALKLTSNPSVTADSSAAYFWNQGGVGPTIGGLKFQVQTNGSTAAMTIDDSQRVGIGTSSPTEKLAVNGNIETVEPQGKIGFNVGDAYGDYPHYGLGKSSGSNPVNLAGYYGVTFGTAGAERARIDDGGNFMLGTTTPLLTTTGRNTLTLNGTSTSIITLSNGGTWKSYFYNDGTNTYVGAQGGFGVAVNGAGTVAMYINSSANVGIGTDSPSQKLHVAGNLRVTGAIYDSNNSAGSSGEILTSTGTGTDWVSLSSISGVDGTGTANYVPKWTDTDTIGNSAIYDSSGNIGIGTTNPGAKLEVVGTFRATTKSFIIDHPTKENKKLQYGVLEGPEHSVYVRGKLTNTNVIQLPDYWHALVDEDSITVNLTAIGKKQDLWVEEITDTHITVASETGDINCFYAVFAERKDVEKLVTEFDKE